MHFQCGTQEIKCESVIIMEVVSLIPYTGCWQAEIVYLFLIMAMYFLWDPVNIFEFKVFAPFMNGRILLVSNSILKNTSSQKPKKLTKAHQ